MGGRGLAEGPYTDYIELFIDYKRGKGEKGGDTLLIACRKISASLASEAEACGLDERTVRSALERLEGEGDWPHSRRVSVMRQFCSFLSTLGIPCWQVPPKFCPAPKSDFRPYIFTDDDIAALFAAADRSPAPGGYPGCELVTPTLVRLLASTGVRISEALALDIEDFSADAETVKVVNSKNGVSRIVPLSGSMADWLRRYVLATERDAGALFTSPYTGIGWKRGGAYCMFEKLYASSGIRNEFGRPPRIHDLRHTFCTRSLDKMLASGMSLYEAVPILAAYVGHVCYEHTERYIHLTSAGHGTFVEAEASLGDIIPKAVV